MLGNETMKNGTASYIKAFSRKNTVLKDYVDHMQQAYALPDASKNLPDGMNIEEWCDQWLNTSGVNILEPVVEWNEDGSIKSLAVK
jgi:aminopeptidase N